MRTVEVYPTQIFGLLNIRLAESGTETRQVTPEGNVLITRTAAVRYDGAAMRVTTLEAYQNEAHELESISTYRKASVSISFKPGLVSEGDDEHYGGWALFETISPQILDLLLNGTWSKP